MADNQSSYLDRAGHNAVRVQNNTPQIFQPTKKPWILIRHQTSMLRGSTRPPCQFVGCQLQHRQKVYLKIRESVLQLSLPRYTLQMIPSCPQDLADPNYIYSVSCNPKTKATVFEHTIYPKIEPY